MNATWLYVGVLYAIAVWLARRSGAELKLRVAFVFYALVLIFLFKPMTQSCVDVPVDCVTRIPPWAFVGRAMTVNCDMNDIVTQMVPWADEVRTDWKGFRFPLWSARSGSGSVLLANMQSQALSPLRILALPLPLGESFTAEAAMKFLIALTFAFLFCRRRGYTEIASIAGAIAFGFCTFIVVWLHFGHATVAAFLPAVLFAIDLLAEKGTRGRFVFAIVIAVCVVFGGHPETAFHIFLLALAYVAWNRLGVRRLAAAFVAAVLISAPLLLPFIEALTRSDRFQQMRTNPPALAFIDIAPALLLVEPGFFGMRPANIPWGPASPEAISGFAGILGIAGFIAIIADAIATRRWRSAEVFFAIATVFVVAIMFQWPLIGPAFQRLFSFAENSRVRLLYAFLMAMQSAAAVNMLERGRRLPVRIGVAGAALLLLIMLQFNGAMHNAATLRAIAPSAIVLAVAAIAIVPRLVLVAAIAFELFFAGIRWNPAVDKRWMAATTPLIEKLQSLRAEARVPFRVAGLGAMLYPNTGAMFGLEDIRTHDPMSNARYLGVLRVLAGYSTGDYFAQFQNADSPLLDFLNVLYVVGDPRTTLDADHYQLVYEGKDGRIYRNRRALQRFFAVRNVVLEFKRFAFAQRLATTHDFAQTAIVNELPVASDAMRNDLLAPRPPDAPEPWVNFTWIVDTEYTLQVRAPRHALIASSVPLWPGWRVEINGKRVHPIEVNGAFLGFTVPPGDSTIHVDYVPVSFYAGVILSVLTVAAIIVAATHRR